MKRLLPAIAILAAAAISPPVIAQSNPDEPLPRFEGAICPGVAGLELDYAEAVVGRIRANVSDAGLRLSDEENCEPNVLVAIVEDGPAYLADLTQRRGYLFQEMDRSAVDAMLAQEGPVTVWHQVSTYTRDGLRVGRRDNLVDLPRAGMWQAHSRIYRPVRNDITYALVLFDRNAVGELSLTQLADLASMRALATDFPEEAGGTQETILTVLDTPQDRVASMTPFDRAWLTRLYSGIPNIPASIRLRGVRVSSAD